MSARSTAARWKFVADLRVEGELPDDHLAAAFAAVPREAFLVDGFRTMGGRWISPDDADFLTEVYRNEPLVTKLDSGVPVSSSSQPSLMALMLSALRLAPGMRVLEIGVGSGYNAALLATLGMTVTSVDVQPDVVERACAGLTRAGVAGVRVVLGDGYAGYPPGAPYDRVIVTVGVTGMAPAWLDQLAPGGYLLAPVFHAGVHPVLAVRAGERIARPVCGAGFMTAAGPLGARYPWAHPEPVRGALPPPTLRRPPRWEKPLGPRRYQDLGMAIGAWDRRLTHAALAEVPGADWTLLDERRSGGAVFTPDGGIAATGPQAAAYAARAVTLLDRWTSSGGPDLTDWSVALALAGDPQRPVWAPHRWTLDRPHR